MDLVREVLDFRDTEDARLEAQRPAGVWIGGGSCGFGAALRITCSVLASFWRELIGPVPLTR